MRILHPLVQRNTSTAARTSFATTLVGTEPYLRDHVIAGRKTLPGVAYLEMARAAAELSGMHGAGVVANVVWSRPLTVDGEPREVEIHLQAQGIAQNSPSRPQTRGCTHRDVCPSGLCHAKTWILPIPAGRVDLAAVRARCSSVI